MGNGDNVSDDKVTCSRRILKKDININGKREGGGGRLTEGVRETERERWRCVLGLISA